MSFASYVFLSFGSLFSIVDPFTAVPIFLMLVGGQPRAVQQATALRASATCAIVLTTFGLLGNFLFAVLGISLPAFKIAGGILLFGVGLEMMRARRSETRTTSEEALDAETKEDMGVIPIGMPLLAGPGAIATVLVLVGKARDLAQRASLFATVAVVSFIALVTLRSAPIVARGLGKTGINVIGRVMGLLLAALATQFVIDGLHEARLCG
jgi:multiple antibiotic resistance protein